MSFERCDKALTDKYMTQTDALIDEIENSPTNVEVIGTKYYVAADGNDENDGLSPETAWQTVAKVNEVKFKYGDGVFFKRGDSFRQPYHLNLLQGITYSAYGEGPKPRIIGSVNASGSDKWVQSEYENVYTYFEKIPDERNIGNIIFDDGKAWGICIQKTTDGKRLDLGRVFNGLEWFDTGSDEFKNAGALKNNLEYYYDLNEETLYLCSKNGNPGDVFKSIELADQGPCVSVLKNFFTCLCDVTIDNLELFGGSSGISLQNAYNVTVQYCTFKWIGGSSCGKCGSEKYCNFKCIGGIPCEVCDDENRYLYRFGNAVESYGSNEGLTIHHCYASQVYNSGFAVFFKNTAVMRNIKIYNNVAEYCSTGFAVWQDGGLVENMDIHHNYARLSGYGWSHQRSNKDASFFCGGDATARVFKNCSVHDNINILSSKYALNARPTGPNQYNLNNNVYIMEDGKYLGKLADDPLNGTGNFIDTPYTQDIIESLQADGFEAGSKYYVTNTLQEN